MIKGRRPRPRVAIVGDILDREKIKFNNIFPTIWYAKNFEELSQRIHYTEIDMLIVGCDIRSLPAWHDLLHVICFAENLVEGFSCPNNYCILGNDLSTTEEYELVTMPLNFDRQRKSDLMNINSFKNKRTIKILERTSFSWFESEKAIKYLKKNAIISKPNSRNIYAFSAVRDNNGKGYAWLPGDRFSKPEWCELFSREWAKTDPKSFETFKNWDDEKEWLSPEELDYFNNIEKIENEKNEYLATYEMELSKLNSLYKEAKIKANNEIRNLLTTQGDELVNMVKIYLEFLGFEVIKVDDELEEGKPKREDLRLKVDNFPDWEAIVEIRGYAKSSGTTADLLRLNRFAELYQKEKGKLPNKRIYVVNGQIDLSPSQRQLPLESADEDIQIFAEQSGLVIPTIEIFKTIQLIEKINKDSTIKSIIENTGLWRHPSIST